MIACPVCVAACTQALLSTIALIRATLSAK